MCIRDSRWANDFLPVRTRRPGRSGIRRSFGAALSRNGERSWSTRAHARPMPGRRKAMHSPTVPGPIQSHLGNDGVGNFQCLFFAMPRGRTTPGFPPHLPIGSPSSFQSHGPRSGQTPTRANKPPRRRLLWARSGAAFRAAFGQGLGRSANAPSSKVRRPALALCAQKHRKPMSKARFSYLMRRASGYIVPL